jgi:hypothetical protein
MPAEYEPTDAQRSLVENAAAFGLTQADIAEQLGIGEKTLRKPPTGEAPPPPADFYRTFSGVGRVPARVQDLCRPA